MTRAGDADVLERLIVDLPEQIHVDIVCYERVGILREADCLQPVADPVHGASCSKSALAAMRSAVSKPSVNQP
jgi:hypothetical protein